MREHAISSVITLTVRDSDARKKRERATKATVQLQSYLVELECCRLRCFIRWTLLGKKEENERKKRGKEEILKGWREEGWVKPLAYTRKLMRTGLWCDSIAVLPTGRLAQS